MRRDRKTESWKALLRACAFGAGALAAVSAAAGAAGIVDAASPRGMQSDVVFTLYSPLSSVAQIVRRMMSPLEALRLRQASARRGGSLQGQAIDLSKERFALYVPRVPPPGGYALFIYVSPYEDAQIPREWSSVLDRHGMIFVTAARSGNSANVFDRREPLALLAVYNIESRYLIDARRIYVGGFSGGSRVAERLALGYPELFRGALLYAGSDPLGDGRLPLPEAALFDRFQESTRVVLASGERDDYHLTEDAHSERSMQQWCVFDVARQTIPWTSHELPDASAFDRLLDALERGEKPAPQRLSECRARIGTALDAEIATVGDLLRAGKLDKARRTLARIDAHYGGLAAPRSAELDAELGPTR